MPLSREEFVRRWKISSLSERSGSQTHFNNLCEMLGEPTPPEADPTGDRYTFDKFVGKVYGGKGFADVWFRDRFAWEYKGKHKDLRAAYRQLNDYREELGNPPLLVVSDMNLVEVHTNFTSTKKRVYTFSLDDLQRNVVTATCPLPPLDVLRALFADFNVLRPDRTDARVTQEAAKTFARLAARLELEKRAATATPIHTKEEIAHFLMRLLFCLFADSIDLLPNRLFRVLIQSDDRFTPRIFLRKLRLLFEAMSEPDGIFGPHTIKFFNGGLFDSASIIPMDVADLGILHEASKNYDWAHVAPEIFGTLFERSLNAERRSLIGAHYTSAEDILLLVEPVVMAPLQRRWQEVRDSILTTLHPTAPGMSTGTDPGAGAGAPSFPEPHLGKGGVSSEARPSSLSPETNIRAPFIAPLPHAMSGSAPEPSPPPAPTLLASNPQAEALLAAWFDSLAAVRILDPACGSGNFLYVALRRLLDLWNEARTFAIHHNIQIFTTHAIQRMPSPQQLFGIEIEFYAHELASIVVWIGFLQWKREHGIIHNPEPILQKLTNIQHDDAILRYDETQKSPEHPLGKPYEPTWPQADFIIGNPPFLGGKLLRRELGDAYVDDLFRLWSGRVKAESDLVVYWFEKARNQLEVGQVERVGLLATQGIRGGANRRVLDRIEETASIFWAWSDRNWLLNGAAVHVSMVGFDNGAEQTRVLNGEEVAEIHSDLRNGTNLTSSLRSEENRGICFMGTTKVGDFDIDPATAAKMLAAPLNPNGRPNSHVVRPWVNATDLTRRSRGMYVIDFGTDMSEADAALYELPFEYLKHHVLPKRRENNRSTYADKWWVHGEPRPDLRAALTGTRRFIATPRVSKHRLFVWLKDGTIPDSATFVFARDDDYFIGVLHSSAHELWARRQGTQLREVESGFRYTPQSTFDTFPFPWPPGTEPSDADSPLVRSIADAARTLVQLRDNWLNPPGASDEDLKTRTLTRLYNLRAEGKATWLENAHRTLDEAVFAAYGWPYPLPTQEILARLLALNHARAAAQQPPTPKPAKLDKRPRRRALSPPPATEAPAPLDTPLTPTD